MRKISKTKVLAGILLMLTMITVPGCGSKISLPTSPISTNQSGSSSTTQTTNTISHDSSITNDTALKSLLFAAPSEVPDITLPAGQIISDSLSKFKYMSGQSYYDQTGKSVIETKYAGKILRVTGDHWVAVLNEDKQYSGPYVMLYQDEHGFDNQLAHRDIHEAFFYVTCNFPKTATDQLSKLDAINGETPIRVTVQGKCINFPSPQLENCTIVDAELIKQ